MTIYRILSGDKENSPAIIQFYKTRKGAEKAAEKQKAFWQYVTIDERTENNCFID